MSSFIQQVKFQKNRFEDFVQNDIKIGKRFKDITEKVKQFREEINPTDITIYTAVGVMALGVVLIVGGVTSMLIPGGEIPGICLFIAGFLLLKIGGLALRILYDKSYPTL